MKDSPTFQIGKGFWKELKGFLKKLKGGSKFILHYVVTKLDLIDSESKETDDKRNQHGTQGKTQSNRGAEVLQNQSTTGGEGKKDGAGNENLYKKMTGGGKFFIMLQ